jgi:hypothetical protein
MPSLNACSARAPARPDLWRPSPFFILHLTSYFLLLTSYFPASAGPQHSLLHRHKDTSAERHSPRDSRERAAAHPYPPRKAPLDLASLKGRITRRIPHLAQPAPQHARQRVRTCGALRHSSFFILTSYFLLLTSYFLLLTSYFPASAGPQHSLLHRHKDTSAERHPQRDSRERAAASRQRVPPAGSVHIYAHELK